MAFVAGALAGPRRVVLGLTIASFTIAALMGIVALVRPGSLDETDGRVVLTTVALGAASIAVLCYLAVVSTRFVWLAYLGGACAVVALFTALTLIWVDWDDFGLPDALVRIFGIATIWAASVAQSSLVLALAERAAQSWAVLQGILVATQVCIVLVGGIVTALVLAQDATDGGIRALGVLAILDVLGTVVTVALARFGHRPRMLEVALPAELVAEVDRQARSAGRTREDVVGEALRRYLDGA